MRPSLNCTDDDPAAPQKTSLCSVLTSGPPKRTTGKDPTTHECRSRCRATRRQQNHPRSDHLRSGLQSRSDSMATRAVAQPWSRSLQRQGTSPRRYRWQPEHPRSHGTFLKLGALERLGRSLGRPGTFICRIPEMDSEPRGAFPASVMAMEADLPGALPSKHFLTLLLVSGEAACGCAAVLATVRTPSHKFTTRPCHDRQSCVTYFTSCVQRKRIQKRRRSSAESIRAKRQALETSSAAR